MKIILSLLIFLLLSPLAIAGRLQDITVRVPGGTGIHINDKEILTAAHLVKPYMENAVWIVNGEHEMVGRLKKIDRELDLALLEVDEYMQFGGLGFQLDAEAGDEVIVVGNPGECEDVTVWGRVAGRSEKHLIVDITVMPGVSGGGVFREGKLLGIVVQMYGSGEGWGDWLALVIPSERIIEFLHLEEPHGNMGSQ